MFNKIAIIGVGLIGGSIGLAAKKRKLAREVIGVCRRESSRRKVLKFKAVDKATLNLKQAVANADLVVIAAPVGNIVELALTSSKYMKKGAILTDVGSIKKVIVQKIEKSRDPKVNFVGSHPMAGSDRTGVENADSDIFTEARVIITKTKDTNKKSFSLLKKFWQNLGSRVLILSPGKHDELASLASYLPHVISFALSLSQTKDSLKIAGGSLKDTTRVASSDTELWRDIFLSAAALTSKSIRSFSNNLKIFERALKKKDGGTIKRFLDRAKKIRSHMQ